MGVAFDVAVIVLADPRIEVVGVTGVVAVVSGRYRPRMS
jgi:hypothetical protein